jgi:hypothetical protein
VRSRTELARHALQAHGSPATTEHNGAHEPSPRAKVQGFPPFRAEGI